MIILHNYFRQTTYTLRCSPAKLQALLLSEQGGKRERALDRARRTLCPYGPLDCRCGDSLSARNGSGPGEYAYQTADGRRHADAEAASELALGMKPAEPWSKEEAEEMARSEGYIP